MVGFCFAVEDLRGKPGVVSGLRNDRRGLVRLHVQRDRRGIQLQNGFKERNDLLGGLPHCGCFADFPHHVLGVAEPLRPEVLAVDIGSGDLLSEHPRKVVHADTPAQYGLQLGHHLGEFAGLGDDVDVQSRADVLACANQVERVRVVAHGNEEHQVVRVLRQEGDDVVLRRCIRNLEVVPLQQVRTALVQRRARTDDYRLHDSLDCCSHPRASHAP